MYMTEHAIRSANVVMYRIYPCKPDREFIQIAMHLQIMRIVPAPSLGVQHRKSIKFAVENETWNFFFSFFLRLVSSFLLLFYSVC